MTRGILAAVMAVASLGAVAQNNRSPISQGTDNSSQAVAVSSQNDAARQGTSASRDSNGSAVAHAPANAAPNNEETAAINNGQLPQTSTILPLLGLIGLGSLVAGFFARR